ncbi:MAG: hypothetical protein ACRDLN_07735, partial [Solirubrobacteraceae bacterium]
MSRKDIISICIVAAAISMAVIVPLVADDPAPPSPAQIDATPVDDTVTTPARTVATPPPDASAARREQ